jgi:uncharacterized protein (DUF433 family)
MALEGNENVHSHRFRSGNTWRQALLKGTRISVEMTLEWVASGASRDNIVRSYPQLSVENVEEALNFAAQSLNNETIMTAEI